ncbi:MAG: metallophosphoesterase [Firmicutes bacterium]|nr:metallophosphoesterase [Bacillota bacterium]MDY5676844.1 metallophosphoesterase [Eubacteriales bacterium]
MKIFAISDLHLSINNPKPMDIFGPAWEGYLDKIIDDWNSKVGDDDIVLISGDISWAMKFENAKPDLDLICNLKGTKIILKGNHDYWWSSISELREYLHNNTYAIQNDAYKFGDFVICGSRGWIPFDNGFKSELDEKIYKREIIRMELSLRSAKTLKTNNEKIVVMTHFPPYNYRLENNEMIELFKKYDVDVVVYGHLHNEDKSQKLEFERDGIKYFLTSCDLVGNKLIRIL